MYFGRHKEAGNWCWYDEGQRRNLVDGGAYVSDGEMNSIIARANSEGKIISGDSDGNPVLENPPEPTRREVIAQRLKELHSYLERTDYIAAKLAEGAATREDYSEELASRQAARDEINALEEELADIDSVI